MSLISTIITAHREGVMAGATLRSLLEANEEAARAGFDTEAVVILDNPDPQTRRIFREADADLDIHEVEFGDQGQARNYAISKCSGELIAFLDADDLWSFNWLSESAPLCRDENTIVHPELNYFFGGHNNIFVHIDDSAPYFDSEFLRVANYWDALCLAHRSIYERFPFVSRDIKGGFAYEDWQWNCHTIEAGVRHRVATDTIHFKRRREGSQSSFSLGRKAIVRPSGLHAYDWYES